jgi:hypothetical protein
MIEGGQRHPNVQAAIRHISKGFLVDNLRPHRRLVETCALSDHQ